MITKVSYCFVLNKANGLWKVYIVPKRFKCFDSSRNRNNRVCRYVNLKNNIEEFQTSEVPFPARTLVHLNESQEDDGNIQNLKKEEAKWHKNCALELSASK